MTVDHVVVAAGETDQSRVRAVAETAASVAGPAGATVTVVHVHSPERYERRASALHFEARAPPEADALARRVTAVQRLALALSHHEETDDVAIEIRGLVAEDVGSAITDFADEVGADRIVVGGRRRSPVGKAVFGSTAQAIMLAASCPVTLVPDELRGGDDAVEAADDGATEAESPRSRTPTLAALHGG